MSEALLHGRGYDVVVRAQSLSAFLLDSMRPSTVTYYKDPNEKVAEPEQRLDEFGDPVEVITVADDITPQQIIRDFPDAEVTILQVIERAA